MLRSAFSTADLRSGQGITPSIILPLCMDGVDGPITKVGVARIAFSSASEVLIFTDCLMCLSWLHCLSLFELTPVVAIMAMGPLQLRQFWCLKSAW